MLAVGNQLPCFCSISTTSRESTTSPAIQGDRVLQCVARRIREAMGDSQVAARSSGATNSWC